MGCFDEDILRDIWKTQDKSAFNLEERRLHCPEKAMQVI